MCTIIVLSDNIGLCYFYQLKFVVVCLSNKFFNTYITYFILIHFIIRFVAIDRKIYKNAHKIVVSKGWGSKFRTKECRTTYISEFQNYEYKNNER